MINKAALVKVAPRIEPFADLYLAGMAKAGINTPLRASRFLGQLAVESALFSKTRESLDYSEERLTKRDSRGRRILFGEHRITDAQAKQYGRNKDHPANQRALANLLYGGNFGRKELGNILPNDGWDFRGGGHKQITGRDNWTRFSKEYYGDDRLLKDTSLINTPEVAVASGLWFWTANNLNKIADTGSIDAVSMKVNGAKTPEAIIGREERTLWTQKFYIALS